MFLTSAADTCNLSPITALQKWRPCVTSVIKMHNGDISFQSKLRKVI
jgi:hypothetical protein